MNIKKKKIFGYLSLNRMIHLRLIFETLLQKIVINISARF